MQTDISAQKEILEIIPSPGPQKDWKVLAERIELVKPFAKTIHIDIIDGKFANNTTFMDPEPFKKYTSDMFFELHMMVENPVQYLKPWADAGFKRFIGQIEKMPDQAEFVAQGQLLAEVGLAIDGETGMEELQVPIDDLDCLLFMSIKAGFSGQQFNGAYLEKMEMLRDTTWIPLEVDGGVTDTTILEARGMGATRFVSTSFIYNSDDPRKQYELLQKLVNKPLSAVLEMLKE